MPKQKQCITDTLAIAREWNEAGYFLIPLIYRDKLPHTQLINRVTGQSGWKALAGFKYQTPGIIETWFSYPAVNIGLLCGNGLAVLDFDDLAAWDAWPHKGRFPEVRTSRGVHVYFRNDHIHSTKKAVLDGEVVADLKGNGYVVTAPSIHFTGAKYKWISRPESFDEIPYIVNLDWFFGDMTVSETGSNSTMVLNLPEIDLKRPFAYSAQKIVDMDGITITDPGRDGVFAHGFCPLHDDRNPSFWVHLEHNTWGCFKCGFKNASARMLKNLMEMKNE